MSLFNVIDVNKYPIPQIDQMTRANRKIGLGIMGWADMLIRLGVPYNTDKAIELAENVMGFIQSEGRKVSQELAKERGAFPNFDKSVFAVKQMPPMRNATITTIAPTGTISLIAGCSSGIEPLFAVAYEKHVMDNDKLLEVHNDFVRIAKDRGFYSQELMEKVAKKGSPFGLEEVPEDVQKIFYTSHLIAPEWHIKMQAAFQKHIDNAVSKTVNFPNEATKKDIETAFRLAHQLNCKGVTVYRDGSRDSQVLNINGGKHEEQKTTEQQPLVKMSRNRPERTFGVTERAKIGCGNLYITVNSDDQGICEVFTSLGRNGGCPSQSEATARLISMALRAGVDVQEIINQLKGIRCMSTLRQGSISGNLKVLSCPDAIGKALESYNLTIKKSGGKFTLEALKPPVKEEKKDLMLDIPRPGSGACPECGEKLENESGCVICKYCGYSKCG